MPFGLLLLSTLVLLTSSASASERSGQLSPTGTSVFGWAEHSSEAGQARAVRTVGTLTLSVPGPDVASGRLDHGAYGVEISGTGSTPEGRSFDAFHAPIGAFSVLDLFTLNGTPATRIHEAVLRNRHMGPRYRFLVQLPPERDSFRVFELCNPFRLSFCEPGSPSVAIDGDGGRLTFSPLNAQFAPGAVLDGGSGAFTITISEVTAQQTASKTPAGKSPRGSFAWRIDQAVSNYDVRAPGNGRLLAVSASGAGTVSVASGRVVASKGSLTASYSFLAESAKTPRPIERTVTFTLEGLGESRLASLPSGLELFLVGRVRASTLRGCRPGSRVTVQIADRAKHADEASFRAKGCGFVQWSGPGTETSILRIG